MIIYKIINGGFTPGIFLYHNLSSFSTIKSEESSKDHVLRMGQDWGRGGGGVEKSVLKILVLDHCNLEC